MNQTMRLFWFATAMIALDRAVALVWWNLEANPVVIALGPAAWLTLTAGVLGGMYSLVRLQPYEQKINNMWLAFIGLSHLLILKVNFAVILGVI